MKAPAIPPPAAPIRARSATVRFLMRAWTLGLFLVVGFSHFGALRERAVEAKIWFLRLGLGVDEDRREEVK